ncbi:MAG: hydroxymethylbilane synthase [Alphaproteobacteria bacterium]
MTVKPEYEYPKKIVIGTRGSALALWQARFVADKIANIGQGIEVEVRDIKTSGDWKPCQGEVRLDALQGGKAQFAKEIEEALLNGQIDMAVHSMKDLETVLPDGLIVPYVLARADARDAFLSAHDGVRHFRDLPRFSVVGTASVRRQAFLLSQRPDLKVVPIRGNVETRIEKLKSHQVDATFLAMSGLQRLGLEQEASCILPVEEMLPAAGQGAIGIQIRENDAYKMSFVSQIYCFDTTICVSCERAVLAALGGGCHTPVGVYARFEADENGAGSGVLDVTARVLSPDGRENWEQCARQYVLGLEQACAIGHSMGTYLKGCVPPMVLNANRL